MRTPESKVPTISVAMGVLYRRDSLDLLRRSVESILNQTYTDFEFLICDDGSTSAAQALLEEYSGSDSRIRLLRPGNKLDLASKLNVCLREAKGRYIARMDDDDYSHSDRFEKQIRFLNDRPDIAFVGSNVSLIRGMKPVGQRTFPEYPIVRDFYMTQPYIHSTLLFRKQVLEAESGYSENERQFLCEDYDLLLRLYTHGFYGANLQETLLDYTIPATAKGNRKMRHRWNEALTRFWRFRELGVLPGAIPYVIKPLAVGILPDKLLLRVKKQCERAGE